MINWEIRIQEVCDRLEIDPEVYNDDDDAKEFVARMLGFPTFECFALLPEPSAIIDGRGTTLLEGHKMQQGTIADGCIELIKNHYLLYGDEFDLEKEVNRFVKYLEGNFDSECATVALLKLVTAMGKGFDVLEFDVLQPYEQTLKRLLVMI